MKVCSKCKQERELSCFNKNKTYKDKQYYFKTCKSCLVEYKKLSNKNYRLNNKPHINKYWKSYKLKNSHYNFVRKSITRINNNNFIKSSFTKEQLETLLFTKEQFDNHLNKFDYDKENYQVDHIIPITKFKINKDTPKETLLKINDLRNLMPLSKFQNISKNNKITFEYVPEWHFKDLSAFIKEMIDIDLLDPKDVIINA